MKKTLNRALTLLLTLSMVLSLFAGISVSAGAAGYPKYNNGKAGEVCTSLSGFAKNYYTGSYTYENLSKQRGNALKNSIDALAGNGQRKTHSKDYLKDHFKYSDAVNGSSKELLLFYCGLPYNSSWNGDTNFNREHIWPDSKGGDAAEGDLHSMRPTDRKINSTRSNYPFGNVNGGKEAHAEKNHKNALGGHLGGGFFEPLDSVKGDVARIVMYDYCTYSRLSNLNIVFQSTDVLLDWMKLDPVDEFEMSRNDVIEGIQGNRNPFVDYPELAFLIFNKPIPQMTTPSGNAQGGEEPAPVYNVTAASSNEAWGTVEYKDGIITAAPKDGCEVSGFAVDPEGAAKVTRNGNTFTVTDVKEDCTVTISFEKSDAPAPVYNVTAASSNEAWGTVEYKDGIITAAPKDGCKVSGFAVDPEGAAKVTQNGNTFTVTEVKEDCTVTISFEKSEVPAPVYNVTAASSNEACGTVEYKDGIITAAPKDGCEVSGFAVDPEGAAKVTRNGNTFTVTDVKEDCRITVNFEEIKAPVVTVTPNNKHFGRTEYKDGIITALPRDGYEVKEFEVSPEGAAKVTQNGSTFAVSDVMEDCSVIIYFHKIEEEEEKKEPVDSFTDCGETWYRDAVNYAVENKLMGGVGEGLFAPSDTLTRGMIVTVLYRNAGSPEVTGLSSFSDVPETEWYARAVAWAEDNQVVNGVGEGLFAPEDNVTRDQIAAILYRYAKPEKGEDADFSGFADADKVEDFAKDAMSWAVSCGLLKGDGDLLKPLAPATRAEFATMIMRFLESRKN